MRFVQKWSYACANHFALVMKEDHRKRAVYYYGFFIMLGALVKGMILISAALLLGALLPTLVIVFIFGSLRMLAGGYHMNTYGKCLFVSMGLILAAALTTQYSYQYWNYLSIAILIASTLIIGLYVLIRYAPKDTPNKPIIDKVQIRKFKILSIIYLLTWLILSIIFINYNLKLIIIAMSFGVLLELLSVTPTGHKFFVAVENALDKIVQK